MLHLIFNQTRAPSLIWAKPLLLQFLNCSQETCICPERNTCLPFSSLENCSPQYWCLSSPEDCMKGPGSPAVGLILCKGVVFRLGLWGVGRWAIPHSCLLRPPLQPCSHPPPSDCSRQLWIFLNITIVSCYTKKAGFFFFFTCPCCWHFLAHTTFFPNPGMNELSRNPTEMSPCPPEVVDQSRPFNM